MDNSKNPNQPLWRLFSGASAGVVANTITHPLDVVRARLTVQDLRGGTDYSGIYNCLVTIGKQEGVRGLFKGMS